MLTIKVSDNEKLVKEVRQKIKENDGYCPCKFIKSKDTKCMCKDFRTQTTPGECHCGLYVKVE